MSASICWPKLHVLAGWSFVCLPTNKTSLFYIKSCVLGIQITMIITFDTRPRCGLRNV
jgi:hypothetical protein